MRTLKLKCGTETIVDDDVAVLVCGQNLKRLKGYVYVVYSPTRMKALHRIATEAEDGSEVDHADGNRLNNLRANLRLCSRTENLCNRPRQRNNTTGYKGVDFIKRLGRYRARIRLLNKRRDLGLFLTPELAYAAYCSAAAQLHGDFARL